MTKVIIEITLTDILLHKELPKLLEEVEKALPVSPAKGELPGVIISGRLPVWAFVSIAHLFHPAKWVATFDPRLGGAVVVATHVPDIQVGDVLPVEGAQKVEVKF